MKKILILLIFVFVLLSSGIVLGANACCQVTKSGDSCVFTDVNNCDTSGKIAYTGCEQTSFCEIGCCYSSDEGSCSRNTPRASCEQEEGTSFVNSPSCEIPACAKGCCLIGDQAFFVTQTQCKQVGSDFPDANVQFNSGLNTEAACLEAARSQEMGCCVQTDTATFTTRENCNVASRPAEETTPPPSDSGTTPTPTTPTTPETTTPETTTPETTTPTTPPVTGQATSVGTNNSVGTVEGFYPNMLCSNDKLQSGCAKMHHTNCFDGKVYWFDSCGNRENLYNGKNKDASYNNGYVKEPDSVCKYSAGNKECGNCDYFQGFLCGEAPRDFKPSTGDLTCVSLDCEETQKHDFSPNADGTPKKNGEAWCSYDYQPGAGSDRPGSRHYRHVCIAGQEIVEACKDYREEICIQGTITEEAFETRQALQESFAARGDIIQAACRDNRWEECSKLTNKPDCENQDLVDCYWLEGGLTNVTRAFNTSSGSEVRKTPPGACVPEVPPGLAHWGEKEQPQNLGKGNDTVPALTESGKPLGDTPTNDAVEVCKQASRECQVTYEIGGWENIFGGKGKPVGNKYCEDRNWILAVHDYCQAQGDCGANTNIRGKTTLDGFTIENPKKPGEVLLKTEVDARPDCKDPKRCAEPKDFKEPDFFHRLDDNKGWIGLLGIAATGAWSYGITDQFSAGLLAGPTAIARIVPGGQGFFSAFTAYGVETTGIAAGQSVGQDVATKALTEQLGQETYTKLTNEAMAKALDLQLPKAAASIDALAANEATAGVAKAAGQAIGTAQQAVAKSIAEGVTNPAQLQQVFVQTFQSEAAASGVISQEAAKSLSLSIESQVRTELTSETIKNLNQKAATTVLEENGFKSAANGQFISSGTTSSALADVIGFVNIAMWGYTIYSVVDVLFTKYDTYTISLSCEPWQAPRGGADCETCNEEGRPCSEYKCRSLGQTCRLINQGTSDEKCVNLAPNDVSAPVIKPNKDVLTKGYTLKDNGASGYEIVQRVKPFSPITFGITMNEPAQCKYDTNATIKFDEMKFSFGSSQFLYNQTLGISLPSELATADALKVTNGGTYNLYIKCQDASGNKNDRDYLIRFRIDPTPDLTPPIIEATSIANGAGIAAGQTKTDLSVFLNEPVQACKYSRNDVEYEKMENSFNTCSASGFQTVSKFLSAYECSTGLKDIAVGSNTFYIRCEDIAGNVNDESTIFTLRGTEPLEISSTGPNGTLLYGNITLFAETAIGADNGNAICGYTLNGGTFEFSQTGGTQHQDNLNLSAGNYNIPVTCQDSAGNQATDAITFDIIKDEQPPNLVKIFSDDQSSTLTIETDEPTTCETGKSDFTFGAGVRMSGEETTEHDALIEGEKLTIICRDIFENELKITVYP